MIHEELEKIESRLNEILESADVLDGDEQENMEEEIRDMEESVRELDGRIQFMIGDNWERSEKFAIDFKLIDNINKLIQEVKDEYDFYDADAERAFMFPNGEDED